MNGQGGSATGGRHEPADAYNLFRLTLNAFDTSPTTSSQWRIVSIIPHRCLSRQARYRDQRRFLFTAKYSPGCSNYACNMHDLELVFARWRTRCHDRSEIQGMEYPKKTRWLTATRAIMYALAPLEWGKNYLKLDWGTLCSSGKRAKINIIKQ